MKKLLILLLLIPCTRGVAQPFGAGNIVVVRIGAGESAIAAGVAQPVFLDEYSACGQLVRSIPLPDTLSGVNKMLTLPMSLTDYSEGYISLSPDGQWLALAGYNAAPGTPNVSTTAAASVRRVIGIVDASGNVNTSTALNVFNTTVVRSAITNGAGIWATGGSGGVLYTTAGSTAFNYVTSTTGRSLGIYDNQLYATSTATDLRFAKVGTGLPVTTGHTMTNVPGYPPTGGSPYQFFMTQLGSGPGMDVLYVADNNLLKKYSLVSGSWVSNGTIGVSGDKYRGLTGVLSGTDVILYAVRRNDNSTANGGEVVSFTDNTGHNGNFSGLSPQIIVQSGENVILRSIAMAPQSFTLPLALHSFSGEFIHKQVLLKWKTSDELNNGLFNVQRSADAKQFENIGKVNATIKPAAENNYNFTDAQPLAGESFYRLEQVDRDGKTKLYPVIRINTAFKKTLSFEVLYSSKPGAVQLSLLSDKAVAGTVNVYDMSGRVLASKRINAGKGHSIFLLDMPFIASGIYMASFISLTGEVLTNKFIR